MNLKDEIISVEYAKRFKELGLPQDSPFQWVEVPHKFNIDVNLVKTITETKFNLVFGKYADVPDIQGSWAAYTVGQLFELLPAYIDTKKDEPFNNFFLHVVKRTTENIRYIINYYCDTRELKQDGDPFFATNLIQQPICDPRLADALAKMVIALTEAGYLKYE